MKYESQSKRGKRKPSKLSPGIDVIVRIHDPCRLYELDRALFSLVNQSYSPVHPIIVAQNFSKAGLRKVEAVVNKHDWNFEHHCPSLINVAGEAGQDLRSKLLNVGLAACRARFTAFLDYDDYIYEHAYEYLIQEVLSKDVAAAFGDVVIKHTRRFEECIYCFKSVQNYFTGNSFSELMDHNFCPIHTYVLNRSLIRKEDIYFDECYLRMEDYDFLLRICAKYPVSFETRSTLVGVYNWHVERTNSFMIFGNDATQNAENRIKWQKAKKRIKELKSRIRSELGGIGSD